MYLDSSETRWFSARSIAEGLSQNRGSSAIENQRSFRAVFNQRVCFAAFESATNSASRVDMDTDVWFYDHQQIVKFPSLNK
jgi:hypothetical protein